MVRASDTQSGSPRFESHFGHSLDFFSVVLPVGVLNSIVLFELFVSKYLRVVPVN